MRITPVNKRSVDCGNATFFILFQNLLFKFLEIVLDKFKCKRAAVPNSARLDKIEDKRLTTQESNEFKTSMNTIWNWTSTTFWIVSDESLDLITPDSNFEMLEMLFRVQVTSTFIIIIKFQKCFVYSLLRRYKIIILLLYFTVTCMKKIMSCYVAFSWL